MFTGGAAELLGINPGTLASRLRVLGINKRDVAAGTDTAEGSGIVDSPEAERIGSAVRARTKNKAGRN